VYRGYVGLLDGKPVGIVATVEAAGVLGIYSLATLPEYRRRGVGEALLRTVVARESTAKRLVLQSTEAGYRMYRRIGFKDVAKFAVYLTR
jgi:ribosomal protein S18 acetylase RimI-like enzyme